MNRYLSALVLLFSITTFAQQDSSTTTGAQFGSRTSNGNWKMVAADRDALGNEDRIFEIDWNSIRVSALGVRVKTRITSNAISNTGYNCAPGELRHQKIEKAIAELICNQQGNGSLYRQHEADWKLFRSSKTASGNAMSMYLDMNGINRIQDLVMVATRNSETAIVTFEFDCKGYYKGSGEWRTLDLTDHIPTVPKGYISPERKTEHEVCINASR